LNFFGNDYPSNMPGLSDFNLTLVSVFPTARNAMPSLHFSWALLLLLNIPKKLKHARAFFMAYCFLTVVATLGTGEHYFVDLIAALPFVAMVQAIGLRMSLPGAKGFLSSAGRSGLIFCLFLKLLAVSPDWLRHPTFSWLTTFLLIAHFFFEMRWQRIKSIIQVEPSSSVSLQTA